MSYTDREVAIRYKMALEAIAAANANGAQSKTIYAICASALQHVIPRAETTVAHSNGQVMKVYPPGVRAGEY